MAFWKMTENVTSASSALETPVVDARAGAMIETPYPLSDTLAVVPSDGSP
jgi:hypothetical protein